jgi:hypothetical protein
MSRQDDTPSIDSLLKDSNWEARVAAARAKREKVLAARSAPATAPASASAPAPAPEASPVPAAAASPAAQTPGDDLELFLRRHPVPKKRRHLALALALVAGIGIGVGMATGGLAVWVFWEKAALSDAGSGPESGTLPGDAGTIPSDTGAALRPAEGPEPGAVTRRTPPNLLAVARPQARRDRAAGAAAPVIPDPPGMRMAAPAAETLSPVPAPLPASGLVGRGTLQRLAEAAPADAAPAGEAAAPRPDPVLSARVPAEPGTAGPPASAPLVAEVRDLPGLGPAPGEPIGGAAGSDGLPDEDRPAPRPDVLVAIARPDPSDTGAPVPVLRPDPAARPLPLAARPTAPAGPDEPPTAQLAAPARPPVTLPATPPAASPEAAPDAPPSDLRIYVSGTAGADLPAPLAALLRDTGMAAPAPIALPFATPRSDVRFYHAADAPVARRIAGPIGARVRDFTRYRPAPQPGRIDIYLGD